jgi:sulfur-carrier protein adenylyltransferase/sulfurtransferase
VNPGPLVEPGPDLTAEEVHRYARHLSLPGFGRTAQRRLATARVLVVGAGGLGSPVLQYLAAAGVGTLGVVDDDVVTVTNLQRQVVHRDGDVGRTKVDSAADAVRAINPHVRVRTHPVRLTAENAVELVRAYDVVVDGADNFATRYVVSDATTLTGTPCVWGAVLRYEGQVSVFWSGHGPTYRDLFPEAPAPGEVPTCAEGGVLGVLPGTIGAVMAGEVVKLVTGTGEPLLGRLLLHDALRSTWRELTVVADPDAPPVTEVRGPTVASCGAPGGPAEHEVITAAELEVLLRRRDRGEVAVTVVDVREPWEREGCTIPGSASVPLADLLGRGPEALPDLDADVVVHCETGVRSAQALAALRPAFLHRETRLRHLHGGVQAWLGHVVPTASRGPQS